MSTSVPEDSRTSRTASSITSRLRRPRKSILSRPSASTSPIAYWVTTRLVGALALQRQVLGQVAVADHDGGGVDAVLADQALERPRHVDQLAGGDRAPFGRGRSRPGRRRRTAAPGPACRQSSKPTLTPSGIIFAMRSTIAERQPQHAADVARGRLRRELAERDDLRHPLAAVLVDHVVHDALAAGDGEVDVDVGHRLAARVQEALEQQLVADRVDVGDAAGSTRPASRPPSRGPGRRRRRRLRERDEVPDDQEVVGEAHLADRLQLELRAAPRARA